MKTLKIIIAAATLLCAVSCNKEKKPEDPVTPDMYTVVFGTSLRSVTAPSVKGTAVAGSIDWGDGTSEDWKDGASKTYSEETRHTVTVKVENATSVTFGSLEGVTSLDFSRFL